MLKVNEDIVFTEGKTSMFHNWSNEEFPSEDFPCSWDSRPIKPIQPGETVDIPQYLAFHMAKHLAEREIIKKSVLDEKDPILNGDMKYKFMEKALIGEGRESGNKAEEISFEVISKKEEVVEEEEAPAKKKGAKPKKVVEPEPSNEINEDFEE